MDNNQYNGLNPEQIILPVHGAPEAVWGSITETLDEFSSPSVATLAESLPVHKADSTSWNSIIAHIPAQKLSWITPLFLNVIFVGCIIFLLLPVKGDAIIINKAQAQTISSHKGSSSSRKEKNNTLPIVIAQDSQAEATYKATEKKKTIAQQAIPLHPQPEIKTAIAEVPIQQPEPTRTMISDLEATQNFTASVIPSSSPILLADTLYKNKNLRASQPLPLVTKNSSSRNYFLRAETGMIFSVTDSEKQDHFDSGYETGLVFGFYQDRMRFETGLHMATINYQGSHVLNYFQFHYVGTVIDMQVEEGFRILPSGDTIQTIKYNPVLRDIYDSVSAEYDAEITNRIKYLHIPLLAGRQIIHHKRYDLFLSGGAIVSIPFSTTYNNLFSPEGHFKISQDKITVPLDVKTRLLFCGQLDATVHITNMLSWYAGVAIRYGKGKNGFNTEYSEWKEWQGTIKTGIHIQF